MKKRIVFDFDGVIHSYISGWQGIDNMPDPPVNGIDQLLDKLARMGWLIYIVSSRCETDEGYIAVREYLNKYNIPFSYITNVKPPASVYVDDRGLTFKGDTSDNFLNEILNFKTWQEEKKPDFRPDIVRINPEKIEKVKAEIRTFPGEMYNPEDIKMELVYRIAREIVDDVSIMEIMCAGVPEKRYVAEFKYVKGGFENEEKL